MHRLSCLAARSPSPTHEEQHTTPRLSGNVLSSEHAPPSPAKSVSAPEPDAAPAPESCGSDGWCSDRSIHLNDMDNMECEPRKEEDSLAWLLVDSEDGKEMESSPSKPWSSPGMPKSPDLDVIAIKDSVLEDKSPVILINSPVRPAPHEASPTPAISSPSRLWPSSPHHSPMVAPSPSLPIWVASRARIAPGDPEDQYLQGRGGPLPGNGRPQGREKEDLQQEDSHQLEEGHQGVDGHSMQHQTPLKEEAMTNSLAIHHQCSQGPEPKQKASSSSGRYTQESTQITQP
ncbi:hypothetical protein EI94DRAFT_1808198 [Lactarius quietus]|nr:hypothetical protein EI94DRAFT_1808198 [Lactarius quietus]